MQDLFKSRDVLKVGNKQYVIFRLDALEKAGLTKLSKLPFSIRIMLEAALRQCNDNEITQEDVKNIAAWTPERRAPWHSLPACAAWSCRISPACPPWWTWLPCAPRLPVWAATRRRSIRLCRWTWSSTIRSRWISSPPPMRLQRNTEMEFQRNRERYEFLKWGQKAFSNFRVVPPMTGIVHQVNLGISGRSCDDQKPDRQTGCLAFPDTLVGTDSHTTMINGLGVVGWGVGGIEAEAVMLGQPMDMLLPDVIGFKLYGKLSEGVTATDLVLTVTQMLRKKRRGG